MPDHSEPIRCSASLRPILKSHEVAALLRIDDRALLKRVRAGKVPEARASIQRTGWVFDCRDVERMIEEHIEDPSERETTRRSLLGLRAGALRAVGGVFEPKAHHAWEHGAPRRSPADALLDTELEQVLRTARAALGDGMTDGQFDAWAAVHADGLCAIDLVLRLSAPWEQLAGDAPCSADPDAWDLSDWRQALRAAAEHFGKPAPAGRFDAWARSVGCPHTAASIRNGRNWSDRQLEAGVLGPQPEQGLPDSGSDFR